MTKMNDLGWIVWVRPDGRFSQSYPNGDFEDYSMTELDDLRFQESGWHPISMYEFKKIIRGRSPHLAKIYQEYLEEK